MTPSPQDRARPAPAPIRSEVAILGALRLGDGLERLLDRLEGRR